MNKPCFIICNLLGKITVHIVNLLFLVEICQKKWKSLREKYHREKQKAEQYYRSGSGAIAFPKWHLMSFFEFMFDKVKPRQYVLFDAIKKIGSKDLVNKQ